MSRLRTHVLPTDDLEPGRLAALTRLCEAAFDEPFALAWERVGPGLHVFAEADGILVAHAMIVDRQLYLGQEMDVAIDTGYVEHVATLPEAQGRGYGSAVMREIGRHIRENFALGALGTGSNAFYERLGWETWNGPTSVRLPDGDRARTAAEDGHVMVLRTPQMPAGLTLDGPIAIEWRPDEPW